MKQIPLTKGKFALVDDEDYDRIISMGKWCMGTNYAMKSIYPQGKKGKKITLSMHREGLGASKDMHVDHINGDQLDNRKENLRICTHAENTRNKKLSKNSTTGFKGVHFFKRKRSYMAKIGVDGKRIHLGCFKTDIEAAKAYNAGALKYHGEFANLNQVPN